MLRFEWNALRTGDHVLVHDPGSDEMALTSGVVAVVDAHRGANGVGIRIASHAGGDAVVWPSHLTVHPDPRRTDDGCWRCQELAVHR